MTPRSTARSQAEKTSCRASRLGPSSRSTSGETKLPRPGWVMMNVENTWDNVWTFRYNVASEDYHTSSRLEVEDPQTQQLRVDLQFAEGESMRMTITQEREDGQEIEQEYFVESDSAPQYFPLDDFEAGKIRVRFYNNGVSDVDARVTVE